MATGMYNRAKLGLGSGDIDWENDDIRVLLLDEEGSYTFDADHNFVANLTPATNELDGTGYARVALAGLDAIQDDANNRARFDANDVTWEEIDAGQVGAIVIYKHVTGDADSILIGYDDTNYPVTTNGGDLTHQWHTDGVFVIRDPS